VSTDYWDKDGVKQTPKFDMKCPFCKTAPTKIYVRMIDFRFTKDSDYGYAADNVYACSKCGYSGMLFGLAVSEKDFEKIIGESFLDA